MDSVVEARLLELERRVRDLETGQLSRTYWPLIAPSNLDDPMTVAIPLTGSITEGMR